MLKWSPSALTPALIAKAAEDVLDDAGHHSSHITRIKDYAEGILRDALKGLQASFVLTDHCSRVCPGRARITRSLTTLREHGDLAVGRSRIRSAIIACRNCNPCCPVCPNLVRSRRQISNLIGAANFH